MTDKSIRVVDFEQAAMLLADAKNEPASNPCTWSEDENGNFEAECGGMFRFDYDGPVKNRFKYCPYCGQEMIEKLFPIEDTEE